MFGCPECKDTKIVRIRLLDDTVEKTAVQEWNEDGTPKRVGTPTTDFIQPVHEEGDKLEYLECTLCFNRFDEAAQV